MFSKFALTPKVGKKDILWYFLDYRVMQYGAETLDNVELSPEAVLNKGYGGNPQWIYKMLLTLVKLALDGRLCLDKSADEDDANEGEGDAEKKKKLSLEEIASRRRPERNLHYIWERVDAEMANYYSGITVDDIGRQIQVSVPWIQIFIEEHRSHPSERILGWRFIFARTGDLCDFNIGMNNFLYIMDMLTKKANKDREALLRFTEGFPLYSKKYDWLVQGVSWYAEEFNEDQCMLSDAFARRLNAPGQVASMEYVFSFERSCEKIRLALNARGNEDERVDPAVLTLGSYIISAEAEEASTPASDASDMSSDSNDDENSRTALIAQTSRVQNRAPLNAFGKLRFPFPHRIKHVPIEVRSLNNFIPRPWLASFKFEAKTFQEAMLERMRYQGGLVSNTGEAKMDVRYRTKQRRIMSMVFGGHKTATDLLAALRTNPPKVSKQLKYRLSTWEPWINRTFPNTCEEFVDALSKIQPDVALDVIDAMQLIEFIKDPMGLRNATSSDDFFDRCSPLVSAFPTEELSIHVKNKTNAAGIYAAMAMSESLEVWYIQPWKFMNSSDGENLIIGMLQNDKTVTSYECVLNWMKDLPEDYTPAQPAHVVFDTTLSPLSHALVFDMMDKECLQHVIDAHEDIQMINIVSLKDSDIRVAQNGEIENKDLRGHVLLQGPPGSSKSFGCKAVRECCLPNQCEEVSRRSKLALTVCDNKNSIKVLFDELPFAFYKSVQGAGTDDTALNFEKQAMTQGFIVNITPFINKETGVRSELKTIGWRMQTYLACMNNAKSSVDPAILDRFIAKVILARMRAGRNIVVEKYAMNENATVQAAKRVYIAKWRLRYAIANIVFMLIAISAFPTIDVSVMIPLWPVMIEVLNKHNIKKLGNRLPDHFNCYLQCVCLFHAIDRVFFARNCLIEPGTPFSVKQAVSCVPYLQCTVEHMCIAAGHMLTSFVDPTLDLVLMAIVSMISNNSNGRPEERFASAKGFGYTPTKDYNWYLLDMSTVVREGGTSDDHCVQGLATVLSRFINGHYPVRVSVEVVKNVVSDLLETNFHSKYKYESDRACIERVGGSVEVSIMRTKGNSSNWGFEFCREYIDERVDFATKKMKPGKDYTSIGLEIVERLREEGTRYYAKDPSLCVPEDAKIVTGVSMRYKNTDCKPYAYNVSEPREKKVPEKPMLDSQSSEQTSKESYEEKTPYDEYGEDEAAANEIAAQQEREAERALREAEEEDQSLFADESANHGMSHAAFHGHGESDMMDVVGGGSQPQAQQYEIEVPGFFTEVDIEMLNSILKSQEQAETTLSETVEEIDDSSQHSLLGSRVFEDMNGKAQDTYAPGNMRSRYLRLSQRIETAVPEDKVKASVLRHFMPYPQRIRGIEGAQAGITLAKFKEEQKAQEDIVKQLPLDRGIYEDAVKVIVATLEDLEHTTKADLQTAWQRLQENRAELNAIRESFEQDTLEAAVSGLSISGGAPEASNPAVGSNIADGFGGGDVEILGKKKKKTDTRQNPAGGGKGRKHKPEYM